MRPAEKFSCSPPLVQWISIGFGLPLIRHEISVDSPTLAVTSVGAVITGVPKKGTQNETYRIQGSEAGVVRTNLECEGSATWTNAWILPLPQCICIRLAANFEHFLWLFLKCTKPDVWWRHVKRSNAYVSPLAMICSSPVLVQNTEGMGFPTASHRNDADSPSLTSFSWGVDMILGASEKIRGQKYCTVWQVLCPKVLVLKILDRYQTSNWFPLPGIKKRTFKKSYKAAVPFEDLWIPSDVGLLFLTDKFRNLQRSKYRNLDSTQKTFGIPFESAKFPNYQAVQ